MCSSSTKHHVQNHTTTKADGCTINYFFEGGGGGDGGDGSSIFWGTKYSRLVQEFFNIKNQNDDSRKLFLNFVPMCDCFSSSFA